MHMLSVAMEPVLHKSCPPNCQDMLAWLPHHVALHVLSFLDLGEDLVLKIMHVAETAISLESTKHLNTETDYWVKTFFPS